MGHEQGQMRGRSVFFSIESRYPAPSPLLTSLINFETVNFNLSPVDKINYYCS